MNWLMGWHMGWMALWWICGIAIAVAILRLFFNPGGGDGRSERPETILKRRFAGGEISEEEYKHKLQELRR